MEDSGLNKFSIITSQRIKEAAQLRDAFKKKRELERKIACLIKDFENETGLAIDIIKYQRDITLPIRSPKYTSLSVVIMAEEDREEVG